MEETLVKGYSSFILDDKIIICVGELSNSGKTETINEVGYKLNYPKAKLETRCEGTDFKGYGSCKGFKVGVQTFGYPYSLQLKWLEDLAKKNYKVIVTASRTYGQTVDIVKDVARKYGYKIIGFTLLCTDEPVNVIDWKDLKEFSAEAIIELISKHHCCPVKVPDDYYRV